jgi:hypothetical protein
MLPQVKEHILLPENERGKEESSPKTSKKMWPYQHLDFDLLSSRIMIINNLCFKPSGLWYFLMKVLGK